jgi:hypothetical protein
MVYRIDSSSAGKDADAFREGAKRFQDRHPDLGWEIIAGQYAGQLHITVIAPGGSMQPVPVAPTLDMADSVFTALEQLLTSRF